MMGGIVTIREMMAAIARAQLDPRGVIGSMAGPVGRDLDGTCSIWLYKAKAIIAVLVVA